MANKTLVTVGNLLLAAFAGTSSWAAADDLATAMSQAQGAVAAMSSVPSPIDLHSHSYCSDGAKTPEQLVSEAVAVGLKYYALSDHDTTACLSRAAAAAKTPEAKAAGLTFIPSMEISAEDDTVHILASNINPNAHVLKAFFASQNRARVQRLNDIVEKLKTVGVTLDLKNDILLPKLNRERAADGQPEFTAASAASLSVDELLAQIHGQITRPDIANAMIAAKVVKTSGEAFDTYLGEKGSAYVPMQGPGFRDAIAWVHKAGGLAFLAHPYTIFKYGKFPLTYSGKTYATFEDFAQDLIDAGIDGFEVYLPDNNAVRAENKARVEALIANKKAKSGRDLLETPGSDYHGGGVAVKTLSVGQMSMPPAMAKKLIKALRLP